VEPQVLAMNFEAPVTDAAVTREWCRRCRDGDVLPGTGGVDRGRGKGEIQGVRMIAAAGVPVPRGCGNLTARDIAIYGKDAGSAAVAVAGSAPEWSRWN